MNKEMKKMARWGAKNMPEPLRDRCIWGMKQRTIPDIEKHDDTDFGPSCIDGGGGDHFSRLVSVFHRIVAKSLQIVKRFGPSDGGGDGYGGGGMWAKGR